MKLGSMTLGLAAAGLLTLPAIAAASTALVGQAGAPPAPVSAATTDTAMPGKQVFQEACGSCHDLTVSTDQAKSREDWQATVNRMVSNGAALSDAQVAQVVDYLAKTYGPR